VTIPLRLTGLPATTRDGRLRAAISTVLELARPHGVQASRSRTLASPMSERLEGRRSGVVGAASCGVA
jgi:hypothetical protein